MSDKHLIQVIGRTEDSVIGDSTIYVDTNSTMMAMQKTQMQWVPRTVISEGLILTGGSVADVFTVTGGYVWIDAFVCHVTVVCSANACTMAWSADPTLGAANTPIMAAIEMNACVLGSMVHAVAASGAGVIVANDTTLGIGLPDPILCPAGGIDMTLSTSNLTTGTINAILTYRPASPGAYVVAN